MGCTSSTAVKESPSGHFHDSYQLGKKLGEGAFGQVRVARDRNTSKDFAVKIMDVRHMNQYGEVTSEVDQARVRDTKQEINVWRQLGTHDHCVSLVASFMEEHLYYMVMERCNCSLMDKLVSMPTMTEGDLAETFRGMLKGIGHVHSLSVVHRDIKPDNFLFGNPDTRIVKLCDFGLADKLPKKGKLKGCFGTAPYMSPEMIAGSGYDTGTDIWSFAAMAYLMIFGDFPYMPKEVSSPAMKQAILKGVPEPSFGMSKEQSTRVSFQDRSAEFVKAILQRKPENRCSASEALEMPFLKPKVEKEDLPLKANIRKARKLTHELKKPVNAIQQHGLDELLQKLQEVKGDTAFMFFSEGRKEEDSTPQDNDPADDRILRRRSSGRHSTHSGVLSEKSIRLEPLDTQSTCAGDSGSDDSAKGNRPADTPKSGAPLVDLVPKPKQARKPRS